MTWTELLPLLERAAAAWLVWAWAAALAALVVFIVLLLARPLTRRFASAHAQSWLWLLPLAPLVAPPLWPAASRAAGDADAAPAGERTSWVDDGLALVAPPVWVVRERAPAASAPPQASTPAPSSSSAELAAQGPQADLARRSTAGSAVPAAHPRGGARPSARLLVVLAWWLTSAALLARVALRQRRARALVRGGRPCTDPVLRGRFDALAREAGVDRRVGLRLVDALASPATAGILRPAVLLPTTLASELEGPSLDWILRHELAHVRRRDVAVAALTGCVQALWWLHPAAWLAPALATRARELACDEAALAREPRADGPDAARALLHVLERRTALAPRLAGAVPLTHPESLERRRIMTLLDPDHRPVRGLAPLSTAALALCTLALVASGQRPAAQAAAQDSKPEPEFPAAVDDVADPADEVAATLAGALRMLVDQQQPDGRWRAVAGEDGKYAGELDDVGVTGAVLLALGEADAELAPEARDAALRKGLAWLASRQDAETGHFVLPEPTLVSVPSHAFALMGWIEGQRALGRLDEADVQAALQAAVDASERTRNPYAGWRYGLRPDGDNDSVITGWMLQALALARDAGAEVPREAVDGGFMILDEYYDAASGRVGYNREGAPTSRIVGKQDAFPGEAVEFPTAVALGARLAWGGDPFADDEVLAGAALLVRKAPLWSHARGTIDSYYWAFGSRALRPLGGLIAERWNRTLEEALVLHADRTDSGHVFWAPVDAWHVEGSTLPMTAMCALALQATR